MTDGEASEIERHASSARGTRADDADGEAAEKDTGKHGDKDGGKDNSQEDGEQDGQDRGKADDGDKGEGKQKGQDSDKADNGDDRKKKRWPLIILAVAVVVIVATAVVYWLMTRDLESTDDAYTEGNAVSIAPKISGYVIERHIDDNSFVKAGELLLRIDPRDYITARDQARANLALAHSQLSSARTDLEITRVRAPAGLTQAQAQLTQSHANDYQAHRDFQRLTSVDQRATTATNIDQARAQLQADDAMVSSAVAQLQVAALVPQNIKSAEDAVRQREAQVAQAEANLAQAEINLSYTEIHAPQDGSITSRNVDIGTFVQAGQQVFYIVSPEVWVTANFKETQLARMRQGQHVDISVDAYPALKLHGHVSSFQQGSGARFSIFPAENATGNFVKIVRRLPVKIFIDDGLEPGHSLPLGLSVEPTVHLK